jgi:hypothetical protein
MSQLDKDFKQVAADINAKLQEAADALAKANELAKKAGLDGLIYTQWTTDHLQYEYGLEGQALSDKCDELEAKCEKINVQVLEDELNKAGWSTSSSYC